MYTNSELNLAKLSPPVVKADRAEPDVLHEVYSALLAELTLSASHIEELSRRGLSQEAMDHHGFKSMGGTGRAAIVRKLTGVFAAEVLLKTPGFYLKNDGSESWISIAGKDGLYIPISDQQKRISGIQIKPDEPGDGGKYVYLSSSYHDGPGPGAPVHFPIANSGVSRRVRLTEGYLKSIIATELSGITTLGLPGAYLPDSLLSVLESMNPSEVVMAFDADARRNHHVARSLQNAVYKLDEAGFVTSLEVWPEDAGKGIDDVLANGHTPTLVRGRAARKELNEIVRSSQTEDEIIAWDEPLPFRPQHGPEWPTKALPHETDLYNEAISKSLQVPKGMTGPAILATVASALMGKVEVYISKEWQETCNEYYVPVLPSGERKSQVIKHVNAPLEEHEKALVESAGPEYSQLLTEREIDERRLSDLKSKSAKAESKDALEAEGLRQDAIELAQEMDMAGVPILPKLIVGDITPEKLPILMAQHHGRMTIISTEGGPFATMAGRYNQGVANLDIYTKSYTGDRHVVDRVGRDPETIENPILTMLITIQPGVLKELGANPVFRQRGLSARINYTLPESLVGYRDIDAASVPDELKAAWTRVANRLLNTPEPPNGEPYLLKLSAEAQGLFRKFRMETEVNMRPDGVYDDMLDWANRAPGTAARLAGQLHMLAHADAGTEYPWNQLVSQHVMANAIRLAEYFAEHALIAFDYMGSGGKTGEARKLWESIQRKALTSFSQADLYRDLRRTYTNSSEFNNILVELVDMNYIREVPREMTAKAGRPSSSLYEVNPQTRTFNPFNSVPQLSEGDTTNKVD